MTRVVRMLFVSVLAGLFFVSSASAQNPEAAKAYNEGIRLYKDKNLDEAQVAFQSAIRLANAAGDEETARKATNVAGQLHYSIGVGKMKLGDNTGAMAAFEAGVKARPTDYKNYKGIAILLESGDDTEAGLNAWLKAAEVANTAGEIGEAKKARGKAEWFVGEAVQQGLHDAAIANGNLFLSVEESAVIHYYLAATYNKTAQYQPALEHATKALELEKNRGEHAKIAYEVATAYEGLTQFDKALEYYRQAAVGQYAASAKHKIDQLGGR